MSAGLAEARAQSNTFVVEASIGARPVDLEVTPNGAVAVVRGNIPGLDNPSDHKVSLWSTRTTDSQQAHIVPTPAGAVGRGNLAVSATGLPLFSDAVAVTNDRVIAIGSNAAQDRTYVDILAISYATEPPTATVLKTHTLGQTGTDLIAGLAHDVAITPDGALAVVSHRNWIHVFQMSDGSIAGALHVGGTDSPVGAGPCIPGDARNSVEVTDSRAVVAVSRKADPTPFSPHRTWVYIVDLGVIGVSDPEIKLEFNVGGVPSLPGPDTSPHDLAITPDGLRAVVAVNRKVALFDLVNSSALGAPYPPPPLSLVLDERDWNGVGYDLWDSLEVSNTHAVVLSNRAYGEPWSNLYFWHVDVFDISGSTLGVPWEHTTMWSLPPGSDPPQDPAWDLALSDDGRFASIKTLQQDVALLGIDQPAPTVRRASPPNISPPPDVVGAVGTFTGNDATQILKQTGYDPPWLWAAFVGREGSNVRLRFYDLLASSWAGNYVDVASFPHAPPLAPVLAADLDRSPDGLEVILRTSAPEDDVGQSGKPDWSRYSGLTPGQVGASWGGRGICVVGNGTPGAGDVLKLGRSTAVSISQHPTQASGWVHIVQVQ